MSDARWFDVEHDLRSAAGHFEMAVHIYDEGGFDGDVISVYRAEMALMHSMQSAHTSAEAALLKALVILDEDRPSGQDWHETLLRRVAAERDDEYARPAILDRELYRDLDETRRFRHRAMHGYDRFDAELAAPAVNAARRLRTSLMHVMDRLKAMD